MKLTKNTYDDVEHFCFATFPGVQERTLVVGAFYIFANIDGF